MLSRNEIHIFFRSIDKMDKMWNVKASKFPFDATHIQNIWQSEMNKRSKNKKKKTKLPVLRC